MVADNAAKRPGNFIHASDISRKSASRMGMMVAGMVDRSAC